MVVKDDIEGIVELKEGTYQINLIPRAVFLDNPVGRIFEWIRYVMNVNQHAWVENGENVEHKEVDIASHFSDVGRVDK